MTGTADPILRTVLGDRSAVPGGLVYAHEHLIIDSPLIESKFPHIHLFDVDAAIEEVRTCRDAGVSLMLDAMPISDGRDATRLAEISSSTGVDIISATGIHHDRYYGPLHWTNRVSPEELAALFVDDLLLGIDEFDYTGPIVRRTPHRAGVLKVATSGPSPDERDRRNMTAVAIAHAATGAPILTHCEGGLGGLEQIRVLSELGVEPSSIILSHIDKAHDLAYLRDLAATGTYLELDQSLREREHGDDSITVRAVVSLLEAGAQQQLVVGTDGARRTLWTSLGGTPGLAWLAAELPRTLAAVGVEEDALDDIFRRNAVRALGWTPPVEAV